jgi:hypothetical protein
MAGGCPVVESGGVSNVWVSLNGLCITLVIVVIMHYYGFCINTPPPHDYLRVWP